MHVIDAMSNIEMERIIYAGLDAVLISCYHKLYQYIKEREYEMCEQVLSYFCFELLDLSDVEQVFIARTFFISVITDIIRIQKRKGRLHHRNLTFAYELIAKIERWKNVTEFILNSTFYIEKVRVSIIADDLLFQGCPHMEKALRSEEHTSELQSRG